MSINLKELKSYYEKKVGEINSNISNDKPTPIRLTENTRKIRDGVISLTFHIPNPAGDTNDDCEQSPFITATMYIVDRKTATTVVFVNDRTREVIFNDVGSDAIKKAEKYVCNYIEMNIKRFYGLIIKKTKKNC